MRYDKCFSCREVLIINFLLKHPDMRTGKDIRVVTLWKGFRVAQNITKMGADVALNTGSAFETFWGDTKYDSSF